MVKWGEKELLCWQQKSQMETKKKKKKLKSKQTADSKYVPTQVYVIRNTLYQYSGNQCRGNLYRDKNFSKWEKNNKTKVER